jgi:hypothetical protein
MLRSEVIRRERFLFAEEVGRVGTDWDFFVRFAAIGTFGYVDDVSCLYRLHAASTAAMELSGRAWCLARCRMRAVKLDAFRRCRPAVRTAVFYSLLVVLLRERPEIQREIVHWPEFAALPTKDRVMLFRQMASQAIVFGGKAEAIREWLEQSRLTNRKDLRGAAIRMFYRIHPGLCRVILQTWSSQKVDPLRIPPFADLGHGQA